MEGKVCTVCGKSHRSLDVIAMEIREDWKKVNYAAEPYLNAMQELLCPDDSYFMDSGDSVVRYFLANATTWRGEKAKAIKLELKEIIK